MIKKLFLAVIASCLFVFSGCDLFDTDTGIPKTYAVYYKGDGNKTGIEEIYLWEGHKCIMKFKTGDMWLEVNGTWSGKAVPRASGESFTVNFTSLEDIDTGLPPATYSGFKLNTDYELTFEKEGLTIAEDYPVNYVTNDTFKELWNIIF